MSRKSDRVTYVIAISGNLSDEARDWRSYAGGTIDLPAAWTTADIGFYTCATLGGTYGPFYDALGTLQVVSGPVADGRYELPAALFASGYVKLWSNLAGTLEAQAAARTLVVTLKS